MTSLYRVVRNLCRYASALCAVLMLLWPGIITSYVVVRFLGGRWLFVEEFTGYWLVVIAYLPLGYTLLRGGHIRIELLVSRLKERQQTIAQAISHAIGFVIVSYLLVRSIEWVVNAVRRNLHSQTLLHMYLPPVYAVVSVGLILFALALLVMLANDIRVLQGRDAFHDLQDMDDNGTNVAERENKQ